MTLMAAEELLSNQAMGGIHLEEGVLLELIFSKNFSDNEEILGRLLGKTLSQKLQFLFWKRPMVPLKTSLLKGMLRALHALAKEDPAGRGAPGVPAQGASFLNKG